MSPFYAWLNAWPNKNLKSVEVSKSLENMDPDIPLFQCIRDIKTYALSMYEILNVLCERITTNLSIYNFNNYFTSMVSVQRSANVVNLFFLLQISFLLMESIRPFLFLLICRLEIWPGYVTAAHYMEGGVMLVVDTSHKVLRTTTAYEVM